MLAERMNAGLMTTNIHVGFCQAPDFLIAKTKHITVPIHTREPTTHQTASGGLPMTEIMIVGPSPELTYVEGTGKLAAETRRASIKMGPIPNGPIRMIPITRMSGRK